MLLHFLYSVFMFMNIQEQCEHCEHVDEDIRYFGSIAEFIAHVRLMQCIV